MPYLSPKYVMNTKRKNNPIGVFDSGLGGLTVVHEIQQLLPAEDILYFGDSARLPYGIKSKRQIIQFSWDNARFLLKHKIKALVIACNSSSANAYYVLRGKLPVPVVDVIRPVSRVACERTRNKRVGVIGTGATIRSGAYQKEIRKVNPRIKVYAHSCPLFVSLVEEGWVNNNITRAVVNKYLRSFMKNRIDTLILGCTHYPLLKKVISEEVGHTITIVDSGPSAAQVLVHKLREYNLLRVGKRKGNLKIFVSDLSPHFVTIGERFLKQKIRNIKVVQI